MANFVVLQAIYAKIVESIQARRIRVELNIADQKPEGKKSRKYMEIGACRKFRNLQNFASCEFSQPANFRRLRIFTTYELSQVRNFLPDATIHPAALFMSPALFTILLFDVLTPFCHFLVFFLFCPHCNSICYVILVIFKGGLAIKAPKTSIVEISSPLIKSWAGVFPTAFIFSNSLSFSFTFSTAKHPLRMTTQGMVG